MARSKYDFILELLELKKLSFDQKERILKLSVKEISDENTKDEELLKRIEKIEQLVKSNKNPQNDTETEKSNSVGLPKYIDPSDLYVFLKDYNTDPILKTTCHEIDSNELLNILSFCQIDDYDFIKHRQKVQERFLEFVNDKKYFVDYKIKNLMLVYITGKLYSGQESAWTDDKITINWNSKSLENWSYTNKNKVPHPISGFFENQGSVEFAIKPSINTKILGQKKLNSFSQVVLHFKYLFHLRSDNSLFSILKTINSGTETWKNKIQFEIDSLHFPENLEFFTNVEKLIQAYKILINMILDVVAKNNFEKPYVKLTLEELNDGMELSIHHKNSVFKKTIPNTLDRGALGQTMSNLIKQQINGLCDLYLKADFGNSQFAEINIWNGEPIRSIPLNFFEGVEYKLKFKK